MIFGGAFLITPGFLTDIIGVLLLLPPTRARAPAADPPPRPPRGAWRAGQPTSATTTSTAPPPNTTLPRAARAVSDACPRPRLLRPDRELHGTARSGVTLLFDRASRRRSRRAEVSRDATAGAHRSPTGSRSQFSPRRGPVDLGGVSAHVPRHRRRGRVQARLPRHDRDHRLPPRWEDLDALRASGPVRRGERGARAGAPAARSRRPRSGGGGAGCSSTASCARWRTRASRPSTTATVASATPASSSGCRARTFRGAPSGTCRPGTSLRLEGSQVHAAVFSWRWRAARAPASTSSLFATSRRRRREPARSSRTSAGF